MARLLVVDDDPELCEVLQPQLAKHFATSWQPSALKALETLRTEEFDVVLTDLRMDGMDGLELCDRIVSNHPDLPVVVMTAHSSVDVAVAALRARAHDFVFKPFEIDALVETIASAARRSRAYQAASRVGKNQAPPLDPTHTDLVGASASMRELGELIARVSSLETSVLVTGESGTGKELVARAIHFGSARRNGPFIAVNCAAVPETMLEAELFGHVKGAFTDARADRPGLFVQARGGTLFLDEIAELHVHLQPKLLRAIQERVVRPIGSTREQPCDVRLVTATNRDLRTLVHEGRFREDLFYRINVIDIRVPPLRDREDDVLLCAQHFIERFAKTLGKDVKGFSPDVAVRLLAHSWPGNVRELQNTIERAVALTRSENLVVEDLPEPLRQYRKKRSSTESPTDLTSLDEIERRHISRVIEAVGGNKTAAAEILGVDRRTLLRKETRYGKL